MSWGNFQSPPCGKTALVLRGHQASCPGSQDLVQVHIHQDSELKGLGWGPGIYMTELPGSPAQVVHRPLFEGLCYRADCMAWKAPQS